MSGYTQKFPDDSAGTGTGRIRPFLSAEPGGRPEGDEWTTETPWRIEVLDCWARAEPAIAQAAVRLLSPDEAVRELLYEAVQRLQVRERIRLVIRLLEARELEYPAGAPETLNRLYGLRNDLAHNYTFPVQPLDDHITLMVGKGYGRGEMKRIGYDEMRAAVLDTEPLLSWLGRLNDQYE